MQSREGVNKNTSFPSPIQNQLKGKGVGQMDIFNMRENLPFSFNSAPLHLLFLFVLFPPWQRGSEAGGGGSVVSCMEVIWQHAHPTPRTENTQMERKKLRRSTLTLCPLVPKNEEMVYVAVQQRRQPTWLGDCLH